MSITRLGLHQTFSVMPLVSSSLCLFYAAVETTIFVPFLRSAKTDPSATNRVVRLWWDNFLKYGLYTIFSVTLPTTAAALYALLKLPLTTSEYNLFVAGAAFSLGHFAFVPAIANTIQQICDEEEEKKGRTMTHLRGWLRIHAWRTFLADIPSFLCFAYLAFG